VPQYRVVHVRQRSRVGLWFLVILALTSLDRAALACRHDERPGRLGRVARRVLPRRRTVPGI
jgi:hypothetical protein